MRNHQSSLTLFYSHKTWRNPTIKTTTYRNAARLRYRSPQTPLSARGWSPCAADFSALSGDKNPDSLYTLAATARPYVTSTHLSRREPLWRPGVDVASALTDRSDAAVGVAGWRRTKASPVGLFVTSGWQATMAKATLLVMGKVVTRAGLTITWPLELVVFLPLSLSRRMMALPASAGERRGETNCLEAFMSRGHSCFSASVPPPPPPPPPPAAGLLVCVSVHVCANFAPLGPRSPSCCVAESSKRRKSRMSM